MVAGIDIGTCFCVCARKNAEGKLTFKKERTAFYQIEQGDFTKGLLDNNKVNYIEKGKELYILGDEALKFANLFHKEASRPLAQGMLSPKEKESVPMLRVLIEELVGEPTIPNEVIYFSVPANPVDAVKNNIYHEKVIEEILKNKGYAPKSMNEAMAIVYSELMTNRFSGIAMSFGAGMVNIAMSYLSVPILSFSTAKSGDWIDEMSAQSQGETSSKMQELKETKLDLSVAQEDILLKSIAIHCLDGDTKIALLDGTSPTIREMSDKYTKGDREMWVYSYDEKRNRIIPGKVNWAKEMGEKECWEIIIDNGEKIIASYDHPFLMRNGEYVWASNLKSGDSLMPLYRRTGYEQLFQPYGKWEVTHQIVAEEFLNYGEQDVVHHRDGNKRNNYPNNLEALSHSDHASLTVKERWESDSVESQWYKEHWVKRMGELRKNIPSWNKGLTKETDERIKNSSEKMKIGTKESWKKTRENRVEALKRGWVKRKAKLYNHKVVSVKKLGMRVVYDLNIEKYHNFALACGVFTHNTDALIDYTLKLFTAEFKKSKSLPETGKEKLPIVISGGTSIPKGFVERFKQRLAQIKMPIAIGEVFQANEPLNAVAKGLLIAAEVSLPKA